LNLAQAVLIVGYEWFTAQTEPRAEYLHTGHSRPANKAELIRFFEHFEEALDLSGFLRHPDKRPSMTRNLRNLFQRSGCTEQELRTLHGIITAFMGPRQRSQAPETHEANTTLSSRRKPGPSFQSPSDGLVDLGVRRDVP